MKLADTEKRKGISLHHTAFNTPTHDMCAFSPTTQLIKFNLYNRYISIS